MTNAIGSVPDPERAVDAGIAKTRKALDRDAVERQAAVAPAAPDARGQLVDREA
jgi:hypothetical protein